MRPMPLPAGQTVTVPYLKINNAVINTYSSTQPIETHSPPKLYTKYTFKGGTAYLQVKLCVAISEHFNKYIGI